ncbi:MAG TPA: AAA family ATPase [Tepidiformaceae bacterium]|nr:AAA family ATPase [Tepidiformaceae bacterium]
MTNRATPALQADSSTPLGARILVVGSSCSGKTTVAAHLADRFGLDFVELDALSWKPGWVSASDEEFREKLAAATAGDCWVVAGAYHRFTYPVLWPRAETIIWLDFPLRVLTWRLLRRSWRRWRSKELLWGTNTERFWPQLKIWNKQDSLVAFTWGAHRGKNERYEAGMNAPEWSHIRWFRLRGQREIDAFLRQLDTPTGSAGTLRVRSR